MGKIGTCELCHLKKPLTFHHLIPKKNHRNKWFLKRYEKLEMQTRGINVCRRCHKKIHQLASEKELGRNFNSLELILEDKEMQVYLRWARKQS